MAAGVSLNFQGFVEREHLYCYKNLFANECPQLKCHPLCEFLAKLDLEEYAIIQRENLEFLLPQKHLTAWDKGFLVIDVWAVTYTGITAIF